MQTVDILDEKQMETITKLWIGKKGAMEVLQKTSNPIAIKVLRQKINEFQFELTKAVECVIGYSCNSWRVDFDNKKIIFS